MLYGLKKLIPRSLFTKLQPIYHYALATLGAFLYRFPSRHIQVVGITGTKGKTSTAEIVNALLEAGGYKTALAGTLRFKIGDSSRPNLFKMTMPGRFFIQKFLRDAVEAGCSHAVIEITSEGAKQYRNKWIDLNALVVTNISPEHIESHGSYENYLKAKLSIARGLESSPKDGRVIVVNRDDGEADKFLAFNIPEKLTYSLSFAEPHEAKEDGVWFTYEGERMESNLPGTFNIYNLLAGLTYARYAGVSLEAAKRGIKDLSVIKGRMERVFASDPKLAPAQDFAVVVDYAHTADSLEKAYGVFKDERKICVLGGTGGGRDKWKRKEMGMIADAHCDEVILTDEDPYDENPQDIVNDIAEGIASKTPAIIMDRREAIHAALEKARTGDIVLITGKGTDPYIMGPNGTKTPWSDAIVAREELEKVLQSRI